MIFLSTIDATCGSLIIERLKFGLPAAAMPVFIDGFVVS